MVGRMGNLWFCLVLLNMIDGEYGWWLVRDDDV